MEYEASAVTLSKKLSNGHQSFAGASVYDGIFASPPKKKLGAASPTPTPSSLADDYREIFGGGSEASSIPFLDVPELNEQKVSVDVGSSKLDYLEIFGGGLGDSSFAVPRYEELSQEPNRRKKSEEEWTPAQKLSPSEALENPSFSEGNYAQSPEAVSGVKKFNMSYNKINNGNAIGTSGTNGTTHIAELNAVRGYTCLIDEVTPVRRTQGDKPVVSVVNDSCPRNNAYQGVMEGNNFIRASADVLAGKTVKQTSSGDVESLNSSKWFKSNSMGKSSNNYELGRGTHRPKVPSYSSLPHNFNFGISGDMTDSHGGSTSAYSPPYFDEEVDTNSVAATSAAALRKAIEVAQARLKVAKEIMERKKAGLKNGGKLSFTDRLKPEERNEDNVANGVNRSKKKTRELCEEVETPLHASTGTKQQNTAGSFQVTSNFQIRERVLSSENQETPWKDISSQSDRRCEEAEVSEAEQFYDAENTVENCSPTIEVDIPHVSTVTRMQNVTGPGPVTENFEVQTFVSGNTDTDREALCNKLESSQADHWQEQAETAEAAEQFYEFVEVTRVQSLDENVWEEKIIAEEVFEKPQQCPEELKPAEKLDGLEEVEKSIKIQNGINEAADSSKDGGEPRLQVEVFDHEKNQKQQIAEKQGEGGEIVQAFDENGKCERHPIEFLEPLNVGKLREIWGLEDTKCMKRELTIWEHVESERKEEEDCKQEENEKEQSDAHGLEDNERRFINKAIREERIKERLVGFQLGKEIAKILSHDVEPEGSEKILEGGVSQKEKNEDGQEESGQWVDIERTNTKSGHIEGDWNEMKAVVEEPWNQGSNLGAADSISKQDENDKSENQKPDIFGEDDVTLKVSEEVFSCEGSSRRIPELSKALLEANDSVEEDYDVEETDVLKTDGSPQGLELTKIMKPLEDKTECVFWDEYDTSDEGRIGMNFVQNPRDELASQFEIINDLREHIKELATETETEEYIKESEVAVNQEDDENNTECMGKRGWADSGTNMEEAQLSDSSEGEGSVALDEETESSPSTEKDCENQEEIPISQNAEVNEESQKEAPITQTTDGNEEKDQAAVPVEESTANESLQKEVKLEKEQRRRIDEAKEREREIEKGRIAVERAVREARGRAFAEARERAAAEKAATGARQRPAEPRERVGKTSGELNAKPAAEKAREAKLKAERAAVERATAEARERALEKAMSSKAASEARKQNPQHKGPSSSGTSRYPYSSNNGVSNSTERSDGANVESAQRCKARSERHQRISERAEKALAEKNRRDLLAQQEQAERNRLAETLDIEVKRWSSGKEGNLRALLSTLQYILGPDSGWHPIPLTDIITTAAVKKAYRKATLFVHPDKLQQRGANIQQKYTCEKVFDLLKEACNKFNVEER